MERQEKEKIIGELKGQLAKITSVVLADYRGITVQTVTKVRDDFRAAGCEYHVLKNTLVELAIKGTSMEGMTKHLKGPTAVIWSYEDPAAPAKVAAKWAKDSEKFAIKGGYVDGQVLDKAGVVALASMPGKDELRAKLLATFISAPQKFLQTLLASQQTFMYLLAAKNAQAEETKAA